MKLKKASGNNFEKIDP